MDTFYFSIDGELLDGILSALHVCRETAEKAGAPVESPWIYEEFPVFLRHHGWFSYGYWLSCEGFDFMVTHHDKLPAMFVQIRQAYLYEVGNPLECYSKVKNWLVRWFFDKVGRVATSRLDLCADVLGWPDADLDPRRFTTRAEEWRVRGKGTDTTGLEWGVRGSPCFVRVYDKTLEAVVHRKTWMELLWLPLGWDPGEKEPILDKNGEPKRNKDGSIRTRWKRKPEKVIRLEFELRGEFLDRFAKEGQPHLALKEPEEVLNNVGHIWQYLVGKWTSGADRHKYYVGWHVLRQPSEDGNKSRWPPPKWWEHMAAEGLKQAKMDPIVRRQQDLIDAEALLRQAAGCIARRAAIFGDTTLVEAAQDFAREWARILEEKGTTFAQVIKAKQDIAAHRKRPLEKPAQAAATKTDDDQTEGGTADGRNEQAGGNERPDEGGPGAG